MLSLSWESLRGKGQCHVSQKKWEDVLVFTMSRSLVPWNSDSYPLFPACPVKPKANPNHYL